MFDVFLRNQCHSNQIRISGERKAYWYKDFTEFYFSEQNITIIFSSRLFYWTENTKLIDLHIIFYFQWSFRVIFLEYVSERCEVYTELNVS
jgi:hypothetical protein